MRTHPVDLTSLVWGIILATITGLLAVLVFTDTTLQAMARFRPQTPEHLLALSGVGLKKLQHYGEAFLELLRET